MVDGDGIAHTTYHSQRNCSVSPHDLHDGTSKTVPNYSSEWHEYAVQFSPTQARFFVDGQLVLDVPPCQARQHHQQQAGPKLPQPDTHCGVFFDVGYHLLLNTAIGGDWPQPPDAGTEFPGYHRIDYVRVAQPRGLL